MLCLRCRGLMVHDHCEDFLEVRGPISVGVWRCISCGDIVDPVILKNREKLERVCIATPWNPAMKELCMRL